MILFITVITCRFRKQVAIDPKNTHLRRIVILRWFSSCFLVSFLLHPWWPSPRSRSVECGTLATFGWGIQRAYSMRVQKSWCSIGLLGWWRWCAGRVDSSWTYHRYEVTSLHAFELCTRQRCSIYLIRGSAKTPNYCAVFCTYLQHFVSEGCQGLHWKLESQRVNGFVLPSGWSD